MKINFRNTVYCLLTGFCILFCSCVRDGMTRCPSCIRVKVVAPSGNDTQINNIDMYIFRADDSLVEKITHVNLNEWIGLDYPDEGALKVIAIANSSEDEDIISNPFISESSIVLKPSREFDSKQLQNAPGELFLGNITFANNTTCQEERELRIAPIVSKINIKVKGHRQYTRQLLDLIDLPRQKDFTFVVGTRHLSVDFMGVPCGTPVYYHANNVTSDTSTCEIATFNMFSTESGEEVTIYVYHGKTLIDTITDARYQTRSDSRSVLTAYNGKLLEVYIDYETGMTVALHNTNWLEGNQLWKDF